MPIYLVKDSLAEPDSPGELRLIEAVRPASALRHAVDSRFSVTTPSPLDMHRLGRRGVDIETAGEAIRALNCNFPTFLKSASEGCFELVRGELADDSMRIGLEDVNEFRLGRADLHIIAHLNIDVGVGCNDVVGEALAELVQELGELRIPRGDDLTLRLRRPVGASVFARCCYCH